MTYQYCFDLRDFFDIPIRGICFILCYSKP